MLVERPGSDDNFLSEVDWHEVVVAVICQLQKQQGQCLHFLYSRQMEMLLGHKNVLQSGAVLLLHLLCLCEDGVLPTDAVYGVLIRHVDTLISQLLLLITRLLSHPCCRRRRLLIARLLFLRYKQVISVVSTTCPGSYN